MSKCVSEADLRDAYEVLRGVRAYERGFQAISIPDFSVFEAEKCNVQQLPLGKLKTLADYGRRPKGERLKRPIVVARFESKYIVLDGQHRVHALRERGALKVDGIVIELEQRRRRGAYGYGRRRPRRKELARLKARLLR